jgi:hypothetical protein
MKNQRWIFLPLLLALICWPIITTILIMLALVGFGCAYIKNKVIHWLEQRSYYNDQRSWDRTWANVGSNHRSWYD